MNLEPWRAQIDDLDRQLVELLNRRTSLAIEIARIKARFGARILDGKRERSILARVAGSNAGPLASTAVCRIFRRVLSESRRAAAAATGSQETAP
ncbi:MAG: chorismate mutase [Acidobacteriota bacterium]|jgi:chorismate mutase/prephenate dehydratase|nr:chorismate mutase [Acidobacteriota bacterium]